jgi:hypothetical protein
LWNPLMSAANRRCMAAAAPVEGLLDSGPGRQITLQERPGEACAIAFRTV